MPLPRANSSTAARSEFDVSMSRNDRNHFMLLCCGSFAAALATGCGTTVNRQVTEQLLTSDAVDRSIARLDFSIFAGRSVFLDTNYIARMKNVGFVNADYITSSIRQQLLAAGCLLEESRGEADYVVEARVGALGSDSHEVTYGVPASNALNSAASVLTSAPSLPAIPEISVAKRHAQTAAVKIAAFAYHRDTGSPVWQSGLAESRSSARDTWLFGAGPFQRGSIYRGTQFAGSQLRWPFNGRRRRNVSDEAKVAYSESRVFTAPETLDKALANNINENENHIAPANHETQPGGSDDP